MTRDDVQRWLDAYLEAWRTYDETAIGDLFTEDAAYRYHPWDEPIRGRAEIVRAWVAPEGDQSGRDAPGSWEARYEPWAIDGERAVAVGRTRYFAVGGEPERVYHNVFLLELDRDGRCRSFTELYARQPGAAP